MVGGGKAGCKLAVRTSLKPRINPRQKLPPRYWDEESSREDGCTVHCAWAVVKISPMTNNLRITIYRTTKCHSPPAFAVHYLLNFREGETIPSAGVGHVGMSRVRLGMDLQSGFILRSIPMCGRSKRPPNIELQLDLYSADHDHGAISGSRRYTVSMIAERSELSMHETLLQTVALPANEAELEPGRRRSPNLFLVSMQ